MAITPCQHHSEMIAIISSRDTDLLAGLLQLHPDRQGRVIMSARTIGRLRHVRVGPTNHTVSFSLEYGLTKAWITLEVGDSLHEPDLSAVYRAMLFRLGQVAQEAAASPHLLFADGELGNS